MKALIFHPTQLAFFVYISELAEQVPIFDHTDIVGYTQLTLDEEYDQLLVGARDSIFRLSLDNLNLIEHAEFPAENQQVCLDKGLKAVSVTYCKRDSFELKIICQQLLILSHLNTKENKKNLYWKG